MDSKNGGFRMVAAAEVLLQDIRHALRGLVSAPGFALMVMGVLAVGIGASITVFSILNTLFYKPLPYSNPDRLVMMGGAYTRGQQVGPIAPVRHDDWLDWKSQARSFEDIVAYRRERFIVNLNGEPEQVRGERVAAGYFEMLGVRPKMGRGFLPEEYSTGSPAVLVLSEEYWLRSLNGRLDVIGMTMRVDGAAATVIGVMPGRLRATLIEGGPRMWKPLIPSQAEVTSGKGEYAVLARLKPDVTLTKARAEMTVIGKRLAAGRAVPDEDAAVRVDGLQDTLQWASSAPVARVLIMAVTCLLLISCVNVSGLLLGRAMARHKEAALRTALGASRWRLIRQFLCESLIYAVAGGMAGVGLAHVAIAWCSAKMGPLLANEGIDEFAIDGRVLVFALLVSLATAIVFGVMPALRGSRVDVTNALKEGGGGNSGGTGRQRLTGLLVAVEVALSVVLVASGGLLLHSIQQYWRFDWGIPLEQRFALQATPIDRTFDTDSKRLRFFSELLSRAREVPGVESAALVNSMPVHGGAYAIKVEADGAQAVQAGYRVISAGYHSTAGLAVRAGRTFSESDSEERTPVAMVSESLASALWKEKDAIGGRVQVDGTWRTVVGITADLPQDIMKRPKYEVCVPYLQAPQKSMRVLLRVAGNPGPAAAALRGAVRALDPDLPLGEVESLRTAKDKLGAPYEFIMTLLCSFAVGALMLASAGIYSVTSRAAAVKTREIGIRIALGADSSQILRQVLGSGLKMTLIGTVTGSLLALAIIKLLLTKIWWMAPVSPIYWIAPVAVLMAVLALTASLAPARRCMRVDPMRTLKAE